MQELGYYNPWTEAAGGFSGIGHSVNELALGLAQNRLRQQMMMEQMRMNQERNLTERALNEAMIRRYDTEGGLVRAKTGAENMRVDASRAFGDAMARLASGVEQNPLADLQGPTLLNAQRASTQTANAPLAEAVRQAAIASLLEGQPGRASEFLSRERANMAAPMTERLANMILTGTHSAMSIPDEGTLVDVVSGRPIYSAPRKLNYGQSLVDNNQIIARGPDRPFASSPNAWSTAVNAALSPYFQNMPPDQQRVIRDTLMSGGLTAGGPTGGTNAQPTLQDFTSRGFDAIQGPNGDILVRVRRSDGAEVRIRASDLLNNTDKYTPITRQK